MGISTGIPQVNVPIYSYENKSTGLSLAVSLDYHAGGIRVDEVASDIGIGWALNAGGVISRTIRGIPDEADQGYINTPALPVNELEGNPLGIRANRPFNQMYAEVLDSQNDIFNFSFNGRNGKFMFGKNNDFLLLDMQRLKVEKKIERVEGRNQLMEFTITDENGFKYIFDAEELALNYAMSTNKLYTSSWYLTSIITPSGKDSITFAYEPTSYVYSIGRSASEIIVYPGMTPYRGMAARPFSASTAQQWIRGKRLSSIHFPEGVTISFTYNSVERNDLPGGYLLNKISIKGGNFSRGYKLEQNYELNRATLKRVIPFSGTAEKEDAAYEYSYDIPLPARLSSKQDHWGFYNSNDDDLIPAEILPVMGGGNYGNYQELGGGTRDTDPNRCKAGSLKRIKYPTGGYTIFEMEAHQAVDPRLGEEITYAKEKYSREDAITVYCTSATNTTTSFLFQGDPNSPTDFTVRIPTVSSITCNNSTSCKVVLEIKDSSGLVIDRRYFDPPTGSYSPEHKFPMFTLIPGTYTVTTYTQGLNNYFTYIDFRWRETRIENPVIVQDIIGHKQLYVGGLRAKRISDYNAGATVPVQVQEYDYTLADGTSSGTLGIYPVYSAPVCYFYREQSDDGDFGKQQDPYDGMCPEPNFITRSSSTVHPLAYVNGSPVIYKRVVEKTVGNGHYLGRTERYFKSYDERPLVIYKPFPFTPPDYMEWRYGLLDSVLVFDTDNFLITKEVHGYQYFQDYDLVPGGRLDNFRSVTIAPVKYLLIEGSYWTYPCYFKANNFYPLIGNSKPSNIITYTYDRSGGEAASSITYDYDPAYLYLKSTTSLTSNKGKVVTALTYPQDMVEQGQDPDGLCAKMVAANILSPAVEESLWMEKTPQNRVLQSRIKSNYYRPHPDKIPNVFAPKTVETQSENTPLEIRLRYLRYDERGKAQAVSREGDMPITYVWGYNHSLPIAEVKNASYAEVEAALGGATKVEELAISNTLSQAQLTQLNGLRAQLPEAMVTTYSYDPLVGVTSVTDANGRVSYYEYDDFGRLKSIKDEEGNLVQGLEYHYAGPQNN